MAFGVEWAPRGDDDFQRLPPLLASKVLDAIDQLALDPVRLSRPGRRGHGIYQRYSFEAKDKGDDVLVTIVFQYRQDEMAFEIMGIGLQYR
jgi:hypothetical protein